MVFALPVRSATSASAMYALEKLFSIFGPPHTLHTDNGSTFTFAEFKDFVDHWGVVLRFTPIARPQANPVERAHRTLKSSMVKAAASEKNWDKVLPEIVLAHNSCPNRTTGLSPYFAMFGRSSDVCRLYSSVPSGGEEVADMSCLWELCSKKHVQAKPERQEETCERQSRNFEIGDNVAVKVLSGPKSRKKHFQKGFVVSKPFGDFLCVNSKITDTRRKNILVSKELVILNPTGGEECEM